MQKSLDKLKLGESGKILNISVLNKQLKRRLFDMGLTQGVAVTIKKIAPLGDPIVIELRGYELCMRKCDMKNILVEVGL